MQSIIMTAIGDADILKFQDSPEPEITLPTQIKVNNWQKSKARE